MNTCDPSRTGDGSEGEQRSARRQPEGARGLLHHGFHQPRIADHGQVRAGRQEAAGVEILSRRRNPTNRPPTKDGTWRMLYMKTADTVLGRVALYYETAYKTYDDCVSSRHQNTPPV